MFKIITLMVSLLCYPFGSSAEAKSTVEPPVVNGAYLVGQSCKKTGEYIIIPHEYRRSDTVKLFVYNCKGGNVVLSSSEIKKEEATPDGQTSNF